MLLYIRFWYISGVTTRESINFHQLKIIDQQNNLSNLSSREDSVTNEDRFYEKKMGKDIFRFVAENSWEWFRFC